MRVLRFAVVGCLLVGLCALARADAKKDDDTASTKKKLVGVWEPVKSDLPAGSTVEFTKDGKLKITIKVDDKVVKVGGTYTVEGKTITTTIKDEGKEKTDELTIQTLTDTKLVTKDSKGMIDTFKKQSKSNKED